MNNNVGRTSVRPRVIAGALVVVIPFLLDRLFPFPEARLHRAPAVVVFDRNDQPMRIILPPDGKMRIPVTLGELPPEVTRAVLASEDRWFWRHPGVNPMAIVRAAWSNARARRRVSGASTIPMQIARMAEPKSRTIFGKGIEALRAMQLTAHHSKRELLEIYLNIAPYGANVEGIGAASYVYFGKQPSQLSIGEIAFLTTLPRSPNKYDPLRDHDAATRARDRVLRQLRDRGAFSPSEIAAAMRQPLPRERRRPPFVAPHFCDYAVHLAAGRSRIFTTLDPRIQRIAEQQVAARIEALRAYGVEQTAAVVIDAKTREVVAMVGSAGFFDKARQGEVNGAVARRSPGSTLKPFLYAKAFDDGLLVPDAYVLDVPTDFAGYVPENYDGTYHGRVTVREALIQSLNAPAVRLLADERVDDFVALLRRGGLETLDREPAKYGLPLILGSGEVRLIDLTNLYATLANGGKHREANVLRERSAVGPQSSVLFSPESVQLVTNVLTELRRPDMPRAWQVTREAPAVAWKTGTSYGHRDAWSVGYSERYAIGAWAGNFDGHGVKGMSGSEFAAPLLFDLFRAIEGNAAPLRRGDPATIEVCALSHQLPTDLCRERVRIAYIPGRTRLHACQMHRAMFVDARSGARLAGDCIANTPHKRVVATIYPPELVAWWRAQNQPFDAPPPLSPSCASIADGAAPRITSPDGATPYRLRRGIDAALQEIVLTADSSDAAQLFWFEDGTLIASGDPARKMFLRPTRGRHEVVVVDDSGRSDRVRFRVE